MAELAHIAHIHGELDASQRYAETYLQRCLERDHAIDSAYALYTHAFYARLQGDQERAYSSAHAALDIFSQSHPTAMSPGEQLFELRAQNELARVEGNYTASQESLEQAVSLIQAMGNHYLLADALFDQACFAQQQGKYLDARHLAQHTIKIAESKKLSHFYRRSIHLLRQLAEAKEQQR